MISSNWNNNSWMSGGNLVIHRQIISWRFDLLLRLEKEIYCCSWKRLQQGPFSADGGIEFEADLGTSSSAPQRTHLRYLGFSTRERKMAYDLHRRENITQAGLDFVRELSAVPGSNNARCYRNWHWRCITPS